MGIAVFFGGARQGHPLTLRKPHLFFFFPACIGTTLKNFLLCMHDFRIIQFAACGRLEPKLFSRFYLAFKQFLKSCYEAPGLHAHY